VYNLWVAGSEYRARWCTTFRLPGVNTEPAKAGTPTFPDDRARWCTTFRLPVLVLAMFSGKASKSF